MASLFFTIGISLAAGALLYWWIADRKEHSDYAKGAADIINWLYLESPTDEGIIRLRDGGLMATYCYQGKDLASAEPPERNQLSELLNDFFKGYENGWAFYFTMKRQSASGYPQGQTFPDPVTAAIDSERRQKHRGQGKHYRSVFYLSVVWKPDYMPKTIDFLEKLSQVEDALDRTLKPKRLDGHEHLSFLYSTMHGLHHPITPPKAQEPIDSLLANQDIQVLPVYEPEKHPVKTKLGIPGENTVIVGDKYMRAIAITGFPNATYNGVLQSLNALHCEYRWTSRIITMDRATQEKKIKSLRNQYRIGRKGATEILSDSMSEGQGGDQAVKEAYEDIDSLNKMKDSSVALSKLSARETAFALCTSTVILCSDDYKQLTADSKKILSCLRDAGFTGTVERYQAFSAWKGSLPGQAENIRREFISTYNIADMLPTWLMWSGSERNPSPMMEGASAHFQARTKSGEPFKKHRPSSGDVGHSIIVGATGAGKSTYVNFEISQWLRHKNAQVYLFDKGYTGQLLCQAAGGSHYDLMNDQAISFQPLRNLDQADSAELVWYREWVEDLLRLQDVKPTPKQRGLIKQALVKVAQEPPESRTITQLIIQLQDQELTEALKAYSRDGKYGKILDANSDPIEDSRYQVFELEHILDLSNQILLPVLMYLFHRVERSLSRERPTLIYIEEAWAAFGHKQFAEKLKQWLVTLRKQNGHVGLVTHSPEQLAELETPSLFIGSAPERVFLPNPSALQPETKKLYDLFGLNTEQLQAIVKAEPKKHYYLQTPQGSATIDLDLLPLSLAFIADPSGMSVPQRQEKISDLQEAHGERWPVEWLRFLGMETQAQALASNFDQFSQQPKTQVPL